MALLAVSVTITLSDVVVWLIIGALAGIVLGQAMAGQLLLVIGDLIVGALGALLANLVVGYVVNMGPYGLTGRIIVSIIGAIILIAIMHLTPLRSRYPSYRREPTA
jgi:uncharacterized membrane protein YeaQ/YmgE (transglycosylase-associated protein family)